MLPSLTLWTPGTDPEPWAIVQFEMPEEEIEDDGDGDPDDGDDDDNDPDDEEE